MTLTSLHVIEFDGSDAIVIADPTDEGAFAYPNVTDPDGIWARRVPARLVATTGADDEDAS